MHHGEALDVLVPALNRQRSDSDDDLNGERLPLTGVSSFVVVSVGAFAIAGSDRIECATAANSSRLRRVDDGSDEAIAASEAEVLYEPRYSPFAATRVVESCSAPVWNELLALSLPFEWRESSPALHQHQQRTQSSAFALKVEVVQRGPSQQEDFLLATAIVPLSTLACHRRQVRLALQFAPAASHATASTPARIFVTLREATRDCFEHLSSSSLPSANAADRVEVLVERFVPAAAAIATTASVGGEGVSTHRQSHLRALTLALAVSSSVSALEHELLSDLFTVVGNESSLELLSSDSHAAVTPSATSDKLSARSFPEIAPPTAAESFRWHYPLVFELSRDTEGGAVSAGGSDMSAREIEVALFDTRSLQRQTRIGAGKFPALHEICQLTASDLHHSNGARHALDPPVPIYSVDSKTGTAPTLLGHLHATVRWWSPASWATFVRDTPTRRIVSSNRSIRKNSAMLALGWMGALLRGLNRYPVSSFCDEGGLSSVLARFLSASSSPSPTASPAQQSPARGPVANGEVNALLVSQISHLQAEATAQRQQIERVRCCV